MALPLLLMGGSMLLGGASAFLDYKANKDAGAAAKQAAFFQANISKENARLSELETAQQLAMTEQDQYINQSNAIATAGANGNITGSSLDILLANRQQQQLELNNIKYQGELTKRDYLNEAALGIMSGKAASRAANLKAAGSLLSGAANMAQMGARAKPFM